MIIAVASGKGGTGKTTVSVNLAGVSGPGIQLIDCDVETPNAHLFLRGRPISEEAAGNLVPRIDESACNGCGDCSDFCQFNAIAATGRTAMVFSELCHGCGGCMLVCGRNAISEVDSRIGSVATMDCGHIRFVQGRLDIGISSVSPLIHAVAKRIKPDTDAILDAPPGTSCPAVATLRHADFALLVTEPTPFGLHDLELAVATARELGVPCGVVINRHGTGDGRIQAFCRDERIPVLLELPDDRRIAEAYSQGRLLIDALPEYRGLFAQLRDAILEHNIPSPKRPASTASVLGGSR